MKQKKIKRCMQFANYDDDDDEASHNDSAKA